MKHLMDDELGLEFLTVSNSSSRDHLEDILPVSSLL
jgi:hypothetical protein